MYASHILNTLQKEACGPKGSLIHLQEKRGKCEARDPVATTMTVLETCRQQNKRQALKLTYWMYCKRFSSLPRRQTNNIFRRNRSQASGIGLSRN